MESKKEIVVPEIEEDEDIEDAVEELFFSKESFIQYYKKYNMDFLNPENYIRNDLQREEFIVPNDLRRTDEVLTVAEMTKVIAERAKQIENGAPLFVNLNGEEMTPTDIAKIELSQKMSPFMIKRDVSNDGMFIELWDVNEMILPKKFYE